MAKFHKMTALLDDCVAGVAALAARRKAHKEHIAGLPKAFCVRWKCCIPVYAEGWLQWDEWHPSIHSTLKMLFEEYVATKARVHRWVEHFSIDPKSLDEAAIEAACACGEPWSFVGRGISSAYLVAFFRGTVSWGYALAGVAREKIVREAWEGETPSSWRRRCKQYICYGYDNGLLDAFRRLRSLRARVFAEFKNGESAFACLPHRLVSSVMLGK